MPALHDVQMAFAAAVLSGKPGHLSLYLRPLPLGAERRIQVYRNHFTISLIECLTATFPVLKALVGEAYFNQCARQFAADFPPSSPVLFEYGEAFPSFIARMTRSDNFAYLVDVGALEWAINHAYHADDADPTCVEDLIAVPDQQRGNLILHLHPSARLVVSSYPILDIWRANQPGAANDTVIDLNRGGTRLLIWRNGIDVGWRVLDATQAAFVAALLARSTFSEACTVAAIEDGAFQPAAMLSDLIAGALLAGFSLAPESTQR